MVPDTQSVCRIIRDTATRIILPRFRNLSDDDIRQKAGGSLVTVADTEAELQLAADLMRLIPGSVVVGEEAVEDDPRLLAALEGDVPVWIIDPVDGTKNYADGNACFAVIVAYCVAGKTIGGWIHDPVQDQFVSALAGQGAWTRDRRLHIKPAADIARMNGTVGPKLRSHLQARESAGEGGIPTVVPRYGCIGQEYLDLARGKLDFIQSTQRLKPWDHAAGVLIHAEAGGISAMVDGQVPYDPQLRLLDAATLLLAPDSAAWDSLHRLFTQS